MTPSPLVPAPNDSIERDVRRALEEDIGGGDVTADLLPSGAHARARVITHDAAVLCGRAWFDECFRQVDPATHVTWLAADGDRMAAGAPLCHIEGLAKSLVSAERTALNFLQTLSGTATVTAAYVDAARGTR
ncbi:MAG: nicotinate-nucleotide diphosphorylase, partial [Dokdonella sp.]